jgi:hypothetical protein
VPDPTASATSDVDHAVETPNISFTDIEELTLGPRPAPAPFAASSPTVEADDYVDRLVKYIPSEIIALYLGAVNVVPFKDPSRWTALWIIAGLSAVCTPIYMYVATREGGKPTLWSQIVISSIAFPVWVFAIGGPFRVFSWYDEKQWISAIVITFGTFLVGIYKPEPAPATAS